MAVGRPKTGRKVPKMTEKRRKTAKKGEKCRKNRQKRRFFTAEGEKTGLCGAFRRETVQRLPARRREARRGSPAPDQAEGGQAPRRCWRRSGTGSARRQAETRSAFRAVSDRWRGSPASGRSLSLWWSAGSLTVVCGFAGKKHGAAAAVAQAGSAALCAGRFAPGFA